VCFRIRVCDAGFFDGVAETSCYPIAASSDRHGATTPDSLHVSAAPLGRIDVRAPNTPVDVEIVGYDAGGAATHFGRARGLRVGRDDMRVTVYPHGASSCPAPDSGASVPVARALHHLVPLPGGDVL